MLQIEDLHVSYGGIKALKGISIDVGPGDIVSLLGSNGAGKSTTVRAISGLVPIGSGMINFEGIKLKGMSAHKIQRLGLAHVPEGRKVFANLTVLENLLMGAYNLKDKSERTRLMNQFFEIFPALDNKREQLAGTLSGGEQQMLAIGRAMMSKPRLLMMDEPSLGLAPLVVSDVFNVIKKIRNEGVTILLIEQNANAALKISDYAFLLENGKILLEGPGLELLNDARVKAAYLGDTSDKAIFEN
ncbi:MAG: ABC transporter ATP-binding protein [Syntrophaceae bacterium]|nr:ABC transporter ATP-binding protein [Syntrophaceae bacterium]